MKRLGIPAAIALLAVGLSACAPTAAAPGPEVTTTPTPTASADAGGSSPSPEPDTGATEPTCETIIPRTTAADFSSLGWGVQVETFRIGATEIPDGIQCKWGDNSVTSDRIQMFGWAPIDQATAQKAERDLLSAGWSREDGADGTVYVTENPDWAIGKDADGYGITYLFGDGWVKVADTKQSLILVEWPPAQR